MTRGAKNRTPKEVERQCMMKLKERLTLHDMAEFYDYLKSANVFDLKEALSAHIVFSIPHRVSTSSYPTRK